MYLQTLNEAFDRKIKVFEEIKPIDINSKRKIQWCLEEEIKNDKDWSGQHGAYADYLIEKHLFNIDSFQIAREAIKLGYKVFKTSHGYYGDNPGLLILDKDQYIEPWLDTFDEYFENKKAKDEFISECSDQLSIEELEKLYDEHNMSKTPIQRRKFDITKFKRK